MILDGGREAGNLAGLRNGRGQNFQHALHIGWRVPRAEREADGAECRSVRHFHGAQHMGRVDRARGAGGARRGRDAGLVQLREDDLAQRAIEDDVGGVGQPVCGIARDEAAADAREHARFK